MINKVGANYYSALQPRSTNTGETKVDKTKIVAAVVGDEQEPDYGLLTEIKKIEQRKAEEMDRLQQDLLAAKESISGFGQSMDVYIKCLKIAGNIIAGKDVPESDLNYLQKHDPEMFAMAQMRRMEEEDPEKAEEVADEEESEQESAQISTSSDRTVQPTEVAEASAASADAEV